MRMFMVGACSPERRYRILDPTAPTEFEFENHVARALMCVRPDCICIPFHGTFEFEGSRHRPDLALVARDLSHWFVIEVELVGHSLEWHVLPQVRSFQFGHWQEDAVTSLGKSLEEFSVDRGHARHILEFLPKSTVVVTNKWEAHWEEQLRALDVQLVTVSIFTNGEGTIAYEVAGTLEIPCVNLGFGVYSATDRSIRMAVTTKLQDGEIQFDEATGGVSSWIVARSADATWITKVRGLPALLDGELIQLLRTVEGRISLRRCGPAPSGRP